MKTTTISMHKCYRTKKVTELLGLSDNTAITSKKYSALVHTPKGYTAESIVKQIQHRLYNRPNHPVWVRNRFWDSKSGTWRVAIVNERF